HLPTAGKDGGEAFVLYDLSSSYLEGRKCPLGKLGYSRDGVKGKLQINYGLICDPEGRPVSVSVHPGSAQDQTTVPAAISRVRERFGIERVVFVGDRGMITQAHATSMVNSAMNFISALKAPQIKALVAAGDLQPSLFDEVNLAEISSDRFPGERLVVCRNPAVATERARKRSELLTATERELDKICASTTSPRGALRNADAATIGQRAGKVVNKYKMAKHFSLQIADATFAYERKTEQISAEAALDGFYIIRTTCTAEQISARAAVRAYKQLKVNERAFRAMKDSLEIRPVYHHLEDRVRAHIFLCMLAYYLTYELTLRLAPLLFTDDTPTTNIDPVAPARRSPQGQANASAQRTNCGHRAHTLPDLLSDLATLCRNTLRIHNGATFTRLSEPTPLQATTLQLLDVKLAA
ncbi:MAG: IS1634 family transposase, partial [Actinobacteria bacterium]|nr:IS1634 family transposase [Actinomycetota bacterium]